MNKRECIQTVALGVAFALTLWLLASLFFWPAAQARAAAIRYVAPSGLDTNPGTLAQPLRTVRKGLVLTQPGDTLVLRGGTYVENLGGPTPVAIKPGTAALPITLKAYSGERPVIQGFLWLSRPSYWNISGLVVTWNSANTDTTKHMTRMVNGVGWTLTHCELFGARSFACLLVAGTISGEPAKWTVSYNIIHDNGYYNSANQDQLIYCNTSLAAGPGGLIERNLLYNAINGMGVKVGGADASQGSVGVTVRYNTIYNTSQNLMVSWKGHDNTLYRNLLCKTSTKYWSIRGYQLTGINNTAYENLGFGSKGMFLNDPNYLGIINAGGNLFPVDPQFDSTTSTTGFHPQNPVAKAYGVYAPL